MISRVPTGTLDVKLISIGVLSFLFIMENSTAVFIDGEYLSKIVKHFFDNTPPAYDIRKLAFNLASKKSLWCTDIFYYTAPPYQDPIPTEEQMGRRGNYDRFVSKLKNIPNFM